MVFEKEIGTAKDNATSPVHNWYKFSAGFSHKLFDEIASYESISGPETSVWEPFAGCGTSLVSAQKKGIKAYGNEAQKFMYEVIRGKLAWDIDCESVRQHLLNILDNSIQYEHEKHPLLIGLYSHDDLSFLYNTLAYIESLSNRDSDEYWLIKLALSQTLHKCSLHPIAVPYIVRSKSNNRTKEARVLFSEILEGMLVDVLPLKSSAKTATIFLHDSRQPNTLVEDMSCDFSLTSPPYLNNLDYGEMSKVHSHFYNITSSWNDITHHVRRNLVTAATTHYRERDFILEDAISHFHDAMGKRFSDEIECKFRMLEIESHRRKGGKSFHIMMMHYFMDMMQVMIESRRVLKKHAKMYMVVGDSAPYGISIETSRMLGDIAVAVGWSNYKIYCLRERGHKWKNLKHRHSHSLTENIIVLH